MAKKSKTTKQTLKQPEIVDKLDRWIFYGFMAILVIVPLAFARIFPYNLYITYDQFDIEKVLSIRIITFLIFILWVWKMLVSRKKEIRWSYLDFFVVGFVMLAFLSTLVSIHVPTALHGKFKRFEGLLTFVNYGILYFLGIQTFNSIKRLKVLSTVLTYTGIIVALYGILQYVGIDPFKWAKLPFEERRSFSTFGNPDLLAGFLVIVLPFALVEFMKSKKIKDNVLKGLYDALLLIFCALIFLCLLFAATRGAWIAAAISTILLVVISFRSLIVHPVKAGVIVAVFTGVFAFVAIWSATSDSGVRNLIERIKSSTQITEGSAGARIEIWKAGMKMIQSRPILGSGPDTFRLNSERYETYEYVKGNKGGTVADNAHCYIIQLAVGVGVPATVIFLGFFGMVVYTAVTKTRKIQGEESITISKIIKVRNHKSNSHLRELLDQRMIIDGLIVAIVGYFIHLLFGVSITGSTGVLWILIPAAIGTAPTIKKSIVHSNSELVLKGVMTTGIVVTGMSAIFACQMYYADSCYASAVNYSSASKKMAASGDNETAFKLIGKADAFYSKAISLYKNGRYYDGYGRFLEKLGEDIQDENTINRAIEIYTQGVNFEPLECDHYMYLTFAKLKRIDGSKDAEIDDVMSVVKKGIEVRPLSPMAHMLLGNVYYLKKDYKKAASEVDYALKINPKDVNALELQGQIYKSFGDNKKAKELFERALEIEPGRESIKEALAQLNKEIK